MTYIVSGGALNSTHSLASFLFKYVKRCTQNIKIIDTSGFLTALECTKFVFRTELWLGPRWEAYSAPPNSLAGLRWLTSKREGEKKGKKEGKGRGRKGEGQLPFRKYLVPPLVVTLYCVCVRVCVFVCSFV